MSEVHDTLADREPKYGDWKTNAGTAQALKGVMHAAPSWGRMLPHQRESLEMIATKIGRLLCGDPNNGDSWHDVSGYAGLSERELVKPKIRRGRS